MAMITEQRALFSDPVGLTLVNGGSLSFCVNAHNGAMKTTNSSTESWSNITVKILSGITILTLTRNIMF